MIPNYADPKIIEASRLIPYANYCKICFLSSICSTASGKHMDHINMSKEHPGKRKHSKNYSR
jgi:hypothetical protein